MNTKILKSLFAASLLISPIYSMEVEESLTQSMDVETRLVPVENVTRKRSRNQDEGTRAPRKSQRLIKLAQRNYKFSINNLPDELIHQIFSYLDTDDSLNARIANVRFLKCSLRSWNGELREYRIDWVLFYPRLTKLIKVFEDFSMWHKGFGYWLATNSSLTTLEIIDSEIGPKSTKIIINALWNNTTLTSLNLEDNNIGVTGAKAIFNFLQKNTTLRSLSLRANEIKSKSVLKNLVKALTVNTTLTELDLGENSLYTEDLGIFFEAIKRNTSLTSLNLEQTGFDYDLNGTQGRGGPYIAEILEQNTTLTWLSVRRNDMAGEDSSRIIAQALEKNSTLKELYLGCNNLGCNNLGIPIHGEIFAALKINTSLTVLDLQQNLIHDPHSKIIVEMLGMNTTLKKLYLNNNYITDAGAQVIAEALGKNTNLMELYLDNNKISLKVQGELKEQWGDRIYV